MLPYRIWRPRKCSYNFARASSSSFQIAHTSVKQKRDCIITAQFFPQKLIFNRTICVDFPSRVHDSLPIYFPSQVSMVVYFPAPGIYGCFPTQEDSKHTGLIFFLFPVGNKKKKTVQCHRTKSLRIYFFSRVQG